MGMNIGSAMMSRRAVMGFKADISANWVVGPLWV